MIDIYEEELELLRKFVAYVEEKELVNHQPILDDLQEDIERYENLIKRAKAREAACLKD